MKRRNLLAVALLTTAVAFVGCKDNKKDNETQTQSEVVTEEGNQEAQEVVDMHTSENSLDWAGTYQGVIPCADCPGIETTIVLNEDGTFTKVTVYQDKKDGKFEDKGTFTWDKTGSIVTLKVGDDATQYQVREGSLLMLDTEGKEITGELADKYYLQQK